MEATKQHDHYLVKGKDGRVYQVYPDRPFCTCPDFLFRCVKESTVCKHIRELGGKAP